jgi:hypothetical protein
MGSEDAEYSSRYVGSSFVAFLAPLGLRILRKRRAARRRMIGMPMPRPTPKPTPVTFEEPLSWFALAFALDVAGGFTVVDGAVVMEELGAVVLVLLEEDVELDEIAASVMLK